jgi:hypothetical protein
MQKKINATRARSPIAPTTAPMIIGVMIEVLGEAVAVLEEVTAVLELLGEVLVGLPEAAGAVSLGEVAVREPPAAIACAWDSEKVGTY